MAIVNATDQTFKQETSEGLVLVDFMASWCGPCKIISPFLDEISEEMKEVKIVKVDVDANPESPSQFGVMSIPTLVVLKDGEILSQTSGFHPKEAIVELIKRGMNK